MRVLFLLYQPMQLIESIKRFHYPPLFAFFSSLRFFAASIIFGGFGDAKWIHDVKDNDGQSSILSRKNAPQAQLPAAESCSEPSCMSQKAKVFMAIRHFPNTKAPRVPQPHPQAVLLVSTIHSAMIQSPKCCRLWAILGMLILCLNPRQVRQHPFPKTRQLFLKPHKPKRSLVSFFFER